MSSCVASEMAFIGSCSYNNISSCFWFLWFIVMYANIILIIWFAQNLIIQQAWKWLFILTSTLRSKIYFHLYFESWTSLSSIWSFIIYIYISIFMSIFWTETDGSKYLFLKLFHHDFKIILTRCLHSSSFASYCSPSGKVASSTHLDLKSCDSLYFIPLLWCLNVANDEIFIIFLWKSMSFLILSSTVLLPLWSWLSIIYTSCNSFLICFLDFILPTSKLVHMVFPNQSLYKGILENVV